MQKRLQITRRTAVLAASMLALAATPALAAETVLRWAVGTATLDPTFAHVAVARELGYFKSTGLDLDVNVVPLSGGADTVPVVLSGKAEIGYIGAEPLLIAASEGRAPNVVLIYNQNREVIFPLVVKPESPIKTVNDLVGKTIGVQSLAASSTFYIKGLLRSLGHNPEKDVEFVTVGAGAGSITELQRGTIDVLAQRDTLIAALENRGIKLRHLPTGAYTENYVNGGLLVRPDYLKSHEKELCAFARGMSMGVEFILANPEAAIRIHWKQYPESKPTGVDDETALKQTRHVLESRMNKWNPAGRNPNKHGAYSQTNWMAMVDSLGLKDKLSAAAVEKLYTNALVPCINDFDAEKIRAQARAYQFK
jgi:NitT/TauT family transport system substrate-binding protein